MFYTTLGIMALIIIMIIAAIMMGVQEDKNMNDCEAIGGEYKVVDTETRSQLVGKVVTSRKVDIYGCVK